MVSLDIAGFICLHTPNLYPQLAGVRRLRLGRAVAITLFAAAADRRPGVPAPRSSPTCSRTRCMTGFSCQQISSIVAGSVSVSTRHSADRISISIDDKRYSTANERALFIWIGLRKTD
jgi:hypothetical protein